MTVDTGNHIAPGGGDGRIQAGRRHPLRIIEQANTREPRRVSSNDLSSPIVGHPVRHDDFQAVGWIVLRQNRVERARDEDLLVAHGNHHRHERHRGGRFQRHARVSVCTWPRFLPPLCETAAVWLAFIASR